MRLAIRLRSTFSNLNNKQIKLTLDQPTFSKLENRSLIIVHGPETRKFLQGLTTNNISQLYQGTNTLNPRIALYSLFLNPKGKIVTDAIIIRPQIYVNNKKNFSEDQLWLDVAKQTNVAFFEHLRKYTWKKKVEITNLNFHDGIPDIHAGFNQQIPDQLNKNLGLIKSAAGTYMEIEPQKIVSNENPQDGSYANFAYFDPRGINLGVRFVCGSDGFSYNGKTKKATYQQYQKVCRLYGLTKSQAMVNKLPFMFNSDFFNGFSFNKGCYLGQQIVARAYHTGIVRRRIFPFVLSNQNEKIQIGQTLYGENKVEIGKVFESQPGYGTVLCNYLPLLEQKWPLKISQPSQGIVKMPFEQQLKKYMQEMKTKQARLQQIDL